LVEGASLGRRRWWRRGLVAVFAVIGLVRARLVVVAGGAAE
jgi:hypothetical protein